MVIFEVWNPEISNLELQPFHIQSLFGGLDSRTQEILGSHRSESWNFTASMESVMNPSWLSGEM